MKALSVKKNVLTLTCLLLLQFGYASQALWMRYPALSPDGREVAFSYKGNLYKVSAAGGEARQLTTYPAHHYQPVWSPDGKYIAFAANRAGNYDIYLIPSSGGEAKRLTTHSGSELPLAFTPDGKQVVYSADLQAPAQSAAFPGRVMSQVYQVPLTGGRPQLLMAVPAGSLSFRKDGKSFLYQDRKGFEDTFRKHHTSSVTRDIWLYELAGKKHRQLTDRPGEDTNPVWDASGERFFFLSERSGTYNVFEASVDRPSEAKQISSFKTHPVRFLSISNDNTLCYAYDGEIYLQAAGGKPRKLEVSVVADNTVNELTALNNVGVRSQSVSSDGKQIASVMRGEIFVTSVDYKYTKRITQTPAREDSPSFSPDGKTLVYASERDGLWNIFTAQTARKEETSFFNATLIEEKPLLPAGKYDRAYPQYSPDGKEIAFVEDRQRLMVYNIASKKVRQLTDGTYHPSNGGRIDYEWSPDSKWITLLYTANKHEPYYDVGLLSAQGGEITNLTNSGYMSLDPRWVLDGNAILFTTDRYGMRNHASWGSQRDAMIVFLNQKTYDEFMLTKDEAELLKEEEKKQEKDKDKDKKAKDEAKDKSGKKDEKEKEKSKDIVVELRNLEDRIVRLTPNSSNLGDAVITSKNKLYYTAAFEKDYDLWSIDCRSRETKLEIKAIGSGALYLDKDGKNLFILGSKTQKITLDSNKKKDIAHQAIMEVNHAEERAYMFDHVWRQEQRRFYVSDMHGVDWPLMRKAYARFLPHINNNIDFAEMLSEMLGELNVSHTGARYSHRQANADATAYLGLFFSWNHAKDGLLVEEVLEKGPFDRADSKLKAGCLIEKIDGVAITAGMDYFPLLNKKAGQRVLLACYDPSTGQRWEEIIKARASVSDLLYQRWVKRRAADVERLSKGRLGYVHIQSMADPSFRSIYSDILGKYNDKEAIIIDTRYNGGGRMHEDIEVMFSGKKYFTQVVRGQEACDMPSRRWNKPSIMLMGEANYSNAHGTPWVYKHTGIGKLVGMPVPGTMTSVSWETLQDPSLLFGIPIVGYKLADGSYLENQQLEPDVKIANDPEQLVEGRDQQLEEAVRVLLEDLGK